MIDKAKIFGRVRDFVRGGPAKEYTSEEWLPTHRLEYDEWRALARVLEQREDIDESAVYEILHEVFGEQVVLAWLKAYALESISPGRGKFPQVTKDQTEAALLLAYDRNVVPGRDLEEQWRWIVHRVHDAIPDPDRVQVLIRYATQRIQEVVDPDVKRPQEPASPPPAPPAPEPVRDEFRYEPSGNRIIVHVPRAMRPWKFSLFSRTRHAHLVADLRGVGPYQINMSGAQLRQMAIDAGEPDGSVLAYANTDIPVTGSEQSAGWRIFDPRTSVVGDATRLRPGENK